MLVFKNSQDQVSFQEEVIKRIAETSVEEASDSGAGAIFKIRAVLSSEGGYIPILRCGVTGGLFLEGPVVATAAQAIEIGMAVINKRVQRGKV